MMALILAGGFGKRLWPFTKETPKPLVKVNGMSTLEYNIELLKSHQIKPENIVISLFYKPEKFILESNIGGVTYDIQENNLDTAGALKHAARFLNHPFTIVLNGDTITNLNIFKMILKHIDNPRILATVFTKTNSIHSGGVYIFNPQILKLIPADESMSIHKDLIPLLEKENLVQTYNPPGTYYFDIGTPAKLEKARNYFER